MNKLFYWNQDNDRVTLCFLGIKLKFKNKIFKSKTFKMNGYNNKIYFLNKDYKEESKLKENINGLKIVINGNNNVISLSKNNLYTNCTIFINGDNTNIEILESKFSIRNLGVWCKGNNNLVKISKDSSFESCDIHSIEDNCRVYIGCNCAFSRNVKIYPTEGHSIIDIEKNKIINTPQPIQINDNCWIGDSVIILKGTKIESNTIIGAGSVVTKAIKDSNVVIAGNPAKIIKYNVQWDRDNATNKIAQMHAVVESNPPSCL